jgi:preprotein translocase subunit YajC
MILAGIYAWLALAPAPAPGTQPNPTAQMMQMLGMFAFMGIMIYFLMIRPQQKKAREHGELVKSLKAGDKVLTSGGIIGVVVSVKERTLSIRSADTKLEVLKSAVAEITERSSGTS